MTKEYSFNKPAEEVYNNLKSIIMQSKDVPVELKENLKWEDALKSASINYQGVKARFEITGSNPSLLKIDMSVGFPASLLINEVKISGIIEQVCSQL